MTKAEVGSQLTLRDMLDMTQIVGDIEITNECNEMLLAAEMVDYNVCPLSKVLAKDLLDRRLVSYGSVDGRTMFKVEGLEDAE